MNNVSDYQMVLSSGYFDYNWYLEKYPDVAENNVNPLAHYMEFGWKEDRNPGPWFSTRCYLFENPDVKEAGVNPLLHYLVHGKKEGRKNKFEIIKKEGYVDEDWYMSNYPDIDYAAISPTEHYILFGWCNGMIPFEDWSDEAFFIANPEAADRDICPLYYMNFEVNSAVRSLQDIVVHIWGGFVQKEKKYLVLSCAYHDITVEFEGDKRKHKRPEVCGALRCFEQYIKQEFNEYALFIPVDDISFKNGSLIKLYRESEPEHSIDAKALFIWNLFSLEKILPPKLFFYLKGDRIIVSDKKSFVKQINDSGDKEKIKNIKKIMHTRKSSSMLLFSEFRGITNDNAWELFKNRLKTDKNTFFVTNQNKYDKVTDEELKKHLVVYNSDRHKELIFKTKNLVCSWTLSDIIPTEFKHEFYLYPFMDYNFFYCPHGISYDKNSNFLTPLFLGYPKMIFCSSEMERSYFLYRCGQENVTVTGYPRMDKWIAPETDEITFNFTYRKGYDDIYFEKIAQIVTLVRGKFPDRIINYLFHPAITGPMQRKLKGLIDDSSINYYPATDESNFNEVFNRSKYLITDYSSVAYDFAYRDGAFSVYYLADGLTDGHYDLNPLFYTSHIGVITKEPEELLKILEMKYPPEYINERRTAFYKYLDSNNSQRVLDIIEKEVKNG